MGRPYATAEFIQVAIRPMVKTLSGRDWHNRISLPDGTKILVLRARVLPEPDANSYRAVKL